MEGWGDDDDLNLSDVDLQLESNDSSCNNDSNDSSGADDVKSESQHATPESEVQDPRQKSNRHLSILIGDDSIVKEGEGVASPSLLRAVRKANQKLEAVALLNSSTTSLPELSNANQRTNGNAYDAGFGRVNNNVQYNFEFESEDSSPLCSTNDEKQSVAEYIHDSKCYDKELGNESTDDIDSNNFNSQMSADVVDASDKALSGKQKEYRKMIV